MKLTVEREALVKATNAVKGAVLRRNTIPILSNVLLLAEKNTLRCTATDLDIELSYMIPAEVETEGAITVEAGTFSQIAKKLAAGSQVILELKDDMLSVRAGRSRFTLQTLPVSDFPAFEEKETNCTFSLSSDALERIFGRSQFAISTEEARYYLNGVYFQFIKSRGSKPTLRGVATDGHRLAIIDTEAPEGAEALPGVIVPRNTVSEAIKLADAAETIQVSVSQARIIFSTDTIRLASKLINATYPDYHRVIPAGNDKLLCLDRKDMAAAVDRVSTISSERGRAVKMSMANGKLTLSVQNPDTGSATEELEAIYDAPPLDIGFNSRYLGEILSETAGEKIEIVLADPGSPTLIRSTEDVNATYVLMPMRV